MALAAESEQDLRDLMGIPSNYRVLFLQGGATQHFAQIPMNFAAPDQIADYVVNGAWGEKAVREAMPYVRARIAATFGRCAVHADTGTRLVVARSASPLCPLHAERDHSWRGVSGNPRRR